MHVWVASQSARTNTTPSTATQPEHPPPAYDKNQPQTHPVELHEVEARGVHALEGAPDGVLGGRPRDALGAGHPLCWVGWVGCV